MAQSGEGSSTSVGSVANVRFGVSQGANKEEKRDGTSLPASRIPTESEDVVMVENDEGKKEGHGSSSSNGSSSSSSSSSVGKTWWNEWMSVGDYKRSHPKLANKGDEREEVISDDDEATLQFDPLGMLPVLVVASEDEEDTVSWRREYDKMIFPTRKEEQESARQRFFRAEEERQLEKWVKKVKSQGFEKTMRQYERKFGASRFIDQREKKVLDGSVAELRLLADEEREWLHIES